MKLCKICYPIMAETINKTSKVACIVTKDHEECTNCGYSNDDMARYSLERLRATDENFDKFVVKQLEKKQNVMRF